MGDELSRGHGSEARDVVLGAHGVGERSVVRGHVATVAGGGIGDLCSRQRKRRVVLSESSQEIEGPRTRVLLNVRFSWRKARTCGVAGRELGEAADSLATRGQHVTLTRLGGLQAFKNQTRWCTEPQIHNKNIDLEHGGRLCVLRK